MNREKRLNIAMKEHDWDAVIVSSVHMIRYFCGYTPDLETGPNAFDAGAVILRIERSGAELKGFLLCPEQVKDAVTSEWIDCVTYENYNVETAGFDRHRNYTEAAKHWGGSMSNNQSLAIEKGWVPSIAANFLESADDCTEVINRIRQVKDEDELKAIKAAVELASIGQNAVRCYAQQGLQEIEIFGQIKSEIEKAAGQRIPLLADFVSGPTTAEIGGLPSGRRVSHGELILHDLVPCLNGYWGDSCSVTSIGSVSPKIIEVYKHVRDALEYAKSWIRPGQSVQEIDAKVRKRLEKYGLSYPHHTGHGLGVQYHEGPFITGNGTGAIEKNMVIALEPGAYLADEGFGIRLEDVGLVTDNGFEQWTSYPMDLDK